MWQRMIYFCFLVRKYDADNTGLISKIPYYLVILLFIKALKDGDRFYGSL